MLDNIATNFQQPNLVYTSHLAAHDVNAWSGIPFHVRAQFEKLAQCTYMEALTSADRLRPYVFKWHLTKLFKRSYQWNYEPALIRHLGKKLTEKLAELPTPDFVFDFGNAGCPLAYVETEAPKVFWTDSCFAGLLDAYPHYSNLSAENLRHGHQFEQELIDAADLAVYASAWAAESVAANYRIDRKKLIVIPFGGNFITELEADEVPAIVDARSQSECSLLFVGGDWPRKNGDLVIEIARCLRRMNLSVRLHLIGDVPKEALAFRDDFVVVEGRLHKDVPGHMARLLHLFCTAHFLVMPSKAEAYGCVFSEASSFAVPSIATAVGGIPTAVRDGVNGLLLPANSSAEDFAEQLRDLYLDRPRYRSLSLSAYHDYQSRTNWRVGLQRLFDCVKTLSE